MRERRLTARLARVGLGAVAVLGAGAVVLALLPASTPSIDGSNAVASLEPVVLGGTEQWILSRSRDQSQPVVLFLHGGPGYPLMPLARAFSSHLEDHVVVVHWDQRGAGKSCHDLVPDDSLKLERFVADTVELAEWLRRRFGVDRIVLVGHSWGTVLGVLAVQRRPDLFHAYVGAGQLVHKRRQDEIAYRFVVERAQAAGNERALAALEENAPPYESVGEAAVPELWLGYYAGDARGPRGSGRRLWDFASGWLQLFGTLATTKEYSLRDKVFALPCLIDSAERMGPELEAIDFLESARQLEVPAYFFAGRHDLDTPTELVEEYLEVLDAPHKGLVRFEESGHFPMLDEPERFQRELVERVVRHVVRAP